MFLNEVYMLISSLCYSYAIESLYVYTKDLKVWSNFYLHIYVAAYTWKTHPGQIRCVYQQMWVYTNN